ncbi:MAG: hypothetical protein ABI992_00335 [Chthoniobacterales bacterium]
MKIFPPQNHFAKALLLICVLTNLAVATSNSGTQDGSASSSLLSHPGAAGASSELISIAAGSTNILPIAMEASVTRIPKMTFLFPTIGFLVAISSTQILRRRRAAQIGSLKS